MSSLSRVSETVDVSNEADTTELRGEWVIPLLVRGNADQRSGRLVGYRSIRRSVSSWVSGNVLSFILSSLYMSFPAQSEKEAPLPLLT